MAGLLHRAEQVDVDRGVDVLAVAGLPGRHAVVQPVGDRAVGRLVDPPVDQWIDDRADLGLGRVALGEAFRVRELAVLVHRGVGEGAVQLREPLAELVGVDIVQAEEVTERANADRLAVLRHQFRAPVILELLQVAAGDRADEVVDPAVYLDGLQGGLDHGAQVGVDVAVDTDDRRVPEGPPTRRRDDRLEVRAGRDLAADLCGGGDIGPQHRDVRQRSLGPQPLVHLVRVAFELGHGHVVQPGQIGPLGRGH